MSRMGSATLVLVFISSPAIYGQQEQTRPQPTDRIVLEEVQRDVSPPLRDIVPVPSDMASATRFEREMHEAELAERVRPESSLRTGPAASALTPSIGVPAALVSTTEGLNFQGISSDGWVAPDTNGAVGATQFVQWVNVEFAIYNKSTGNLIYGPAAGNTLWSGFGGLCQNTNNGDPIVLYDQSAARWVMTQYANGGSAYYQCVAVSQTSDATGKYFRYAFQLSSFFPDYSKLGVWPDAYYLSTNLEDPVKNFALQGALVCALNRSRMLSGLSAPSVCFQMSPAAGHTLLPSDWDGSVAPPTGSPNFLINLGSNALRLWKFHVDFQTPGNSTLTGPTTIAVTSFTKACGGGVCVPQKHTKQTLDSLGDRLMHRLVYRRFSDGHESIVANHSVGSPAAIRWYEIRSPNGTPTIFQQGTFRPDSNWRWMGSIATDKVGDIAVGYSVSGGNMYPAIRYAGRVPSDPLGTLESEKTIVSGFGSQRQQSRWGDYSAMSVDPADDCTFWYTNEYLITDGSKNWKTRIASFKFSNCQ